MTKQLRVILIVASLIGARGLTFGPHLGWLDSSCIKVFRCYNSKGEEINPMQLAPFHLSFTQGRVKSFIEGGCVDEYSTFGAASSLERLEYLSNVCGCENLHTRANEKRIERIDDYNFLSTLRIPKHIYSGVDYVLDISIDKITVEYYRVESYLRYKQVQKIILWEK
jgi:hypothetical protein